MASPRKQVRALFDDESITVYQAYSAAVALPAVKAQRLNASPQFKVDRMTWIKPSWCWMMYVIRVPLLHYPFRHHFWIAFHNTSRYRCGYSHKDRGQERVLALRMTHSHFHELLGTARLSTHAGAAADPDSVRVQWDPERGPRLERLQVRSIQIGIPAARCRQWVEERILSIEDVTDRAQELKRSLDVDPALGSEKLVEMGLLPQEREYPLPDAVAQLLGMVE